MEGKDITEIANAVSTAITKLNADTAAAAANEKKDNEEKPGAPEEVFKCPECDAQVKGGIGFCQACGCPLEWGE